MPFLYPGAAVQTHTNVTPQYSQPRASLCTLCCPILGERCHEIPMRGCIKHHRILMLYPTQILHDSTSSLGQMLPFVIFARNSTSSIGTSSKFCCVDLTAQSLMG